MKKLALTATCVLMMLGGVMLLAVTFFRPEIREILGAMSGKLPFLAWLFNLRTLGACAAVTMMLLGGYGLLPPLRLARRSITFAGEQGQVAIRLEPVEASLEEVLGNMPVVKKIRVTVNPDEDGKKALIEADVVLENVPDAGARETAKLVSRYLAETARNVYGLEELAAVNLSISGIEIDAKAYSEILRGGGTAAVQKATPIEGEIATPVAQESQVAEEEPAPEVAPLEVAVTDAPADESEAPVITETVDEDAMSLPDAAAEPGVCDEESAAVDHLPKSVEDEAEDDGESLGGPVAP